MSIVAHKFLSRVLSGLTLVGVFVLAVLPLGQMPKKAGSCGKALCLCVETAHPSTCTVCPITQEPVKAKSRWILVDSQVKAGEPGLAFHPVFSALGTASVERFDCPEVEKSRSNAFDSKAFWLSSTAREIHAPPPRA